MNCDLRLEDVSFSGKINLAPRSAEKFEAFNRAMLARAWLSTHVRNYGDVFWSSCESRLFGDDVGQKGVKIAASEGPFEGRCCPFIVALEGQETLFKFGQRSEIVGGKDLSLKD
jgi:hypothetical protein